jgi:putative tryptophan/tyrosine transport system substrate-binding protein
VTRAAVLRDAIGLGTSQFAAIQTVAHSLKLEVNSVNLRDPGEIERAVAAFARAPNGGLVVTTSGAGAPRTREYLTVAEVESLMDACKDKPTVRPRIWGR